MNYKHCILILETKLTEHDGMILFPKDFCLLLLPATLSSINTLGVLYGLECCIHHHIHLHVFEKQRILGVVIVR